MSLTKTIIYKTITKDDITQLMPIELACHQHPWSMKTFASCLGERYFSEYAILNNNVIGFYVAEHILGEATLMDICVTPEFQGNGFGKSILLRFFQQCHNFTINKIFLEVRASNLSAQMLYINQGFNEISRRAGYYPSNKEFGYEDAIVMAKYF